MEKRVELSLLMDFYAPLLTEHRRQIMDMYLNEDLGLHEIAEALSISRQGVHEAVKAASAQLMRYEEVLGIAARYRGIRREVMACREALKTVRPQPGSEEALKEAILALHRIDTIER